MIVMKMAMAQKRGTNRPADLVMSSIYTLSHSR